MGGRGDKKREGEERGGKGREKVRECTIGHQLHKLQTAELIK